ncbi:hypothetical protein [Sphingosinithalassobacter sp. CS137]|uniref:hypothetical protein n=1 Tax=Sphingosinithalassobacter sp. CS137 TaxID=2762748 RepID=UPI00165D3880|nr:hypothetical protein [Sphingosinithalassobacter sp. CS137]
MAELLDDAPASRRRRKKIALTLLALFVLLLIATILWWTSLPNDDDVLVGQPVAPVTLTGGDLIAAYEADPGLRDLPAGPHRVIAPLVAPPTGTTVLLRTADPLLSIAARISPTDASRLAGLERGAEVVLLCDRIVAGMRAPALEGCTVAMPPA